MSAHPIDIELFKLGDNKAFESVHSKYANDLYNYLFWKFEEMSLEDQQEAISDAFYHSYKMRNEVKCEEDIRKILFTKVKQVSIDRWRKRVRAKKVITALLEQTEVIEDPRAVHNRLDLIVVEQAVKLLPNEMRLVIVGTFYDGFKTWELAGILRKSPQTIRNHRTRALKRLAKQLKELTYEKLPVSLVTPRQKIDCRQELSSR